LRITVCEFADSSRPSPRTYSRRITRIWVSGTHTLVRDLPEGDSAPERGRGRGRGPRVAQLSLLDALELTMLIARKDPSRYPRVAADSGLMATTVSRSLCGERRLS